MEILQIVAIGIVSAVLSIVLKKESPVFSLMICIAASLLILIMLLPHISSVIGFLQNIGDRITASIPYAPVLLKIIGIAYIAEFGSQICHDAGESAIASKIEFGGKIIILTVSSPIIFALLEQVFNMLG